MNLKLLSTLFFVACLAACQAPTDTAAEVSASAAVPSEASVAAGGPGGKDSITTSEARAKHPSQYRRLWVPTLVLSFLVRPSKALLSMRWVAHPMAPYKVIG